MQTIIVFIVFFVILAAIVGAINELLPGPVIKESCERFAERQSFGAFSKFSCKVEALKNSPMACWRAQTPDDYTACAERFTELPETGDQTLPTLVGSDPSASPVIFPTLQPVTP